MSCKKRFSSVLNTGNWVARKQQKRVFSIGILVNWFEKAGKQNFFVVIDFDSESSWKFNYKIFFTPSIELRNFYWGKSEVNLFFLFGRRNEKWVDEFKHSPQMKMIFGAHIVSAHHSRCFHRFFVRCCNT